MFRAAPILLLVLALSGLAATARAQIMPSVPNGGVTITLPSAEATSAPTAPADLHRFGSLSLISIRPLYFVVVPAAHFEISNAVLRDRYAVRQRRAVRTP